MDKQKALLGLGLVPKKKFSFPTSLSSGSATTLVTIRNPIPGFENKIIINKLTDTQISWTEFFQRNGVNLDANLYRIKCSKGTGKLSDNISVLLDGFARKSKLQVDIEKIKSAKRGRKRLSEKVQTPPVEPRGKTTRTTRSQNQDGQGPSTSTRTFQPPRKFGTPAHSTPKFEEDEFEFNEQFAGGISIPPMSDARAAHTNGMNNSHENGVENHDLTDDDDLSQISTDDQHEIDGQNGEVDEIEKRRAHFIRFIQKLPRRELAAIREELVELKLTGSERVYKWSHYAPRTCNFIFAGFRTP